MSEIKIEPYYRHQGKQLVDCLFDKGLFSETLSRDGINDVEGLIALYLQIGAQTAARCHTQAVALGIIPAICPKCGGRRT